MKNASTIIFFIFVSLICLTGLKTQAQCIADAGPDKGLCFDIWSHYDTARVGGAMPVNGGASPYTYQWTVNGTNADAYLDYDTIPNPIVMPNVSWPADTLPLTLTVTDANGATCSDEVTIRHGGSFAYITSGLMQLDMHQGDSIFLAGWILLGGSNISSYLWRPNEGLQDSTSEAFWAKPDVTTTYAVRATNVAGCKSEWVQCYTVNVLPPLAVNEAEGRLDKISVYPNPVKDKLYIASTAKLQSVSLYDITGRMLLQSSSKELNLQGFQTGVYFLSISDPDHHTKRIKVMKQ